MKTASFGLLAGLAAAALAAAALAQQQTSPEQAANPRAQAQSRAAALREKGAEIFKARCATCHEPAIERAPPKAQLAGRWPEEVVAALTTGSMTAMAAGLSDEDKAAVATYLTGRSPDAQAAAPPADPPACAASRTFSLAGPGWNGWSIDPKSSRHQPNPGLTVADLPRLKVKWAMTVSGGRYGQPTLAGGRLFLSTGSGRVYALDAKTGCQHWRFEAPSGVRTTVVLGALPSVAPSGYAAYFGDYARNVYAVDAASGRLLWKTNVEAHPRGVLTGTPVVFQGRLYVPLSSWEETVADAANYPCCTFRGGLAALDPKTGKIAWKTYVIDEAPKPHRKNAAGTQMYGPAGAAVWSAPTFDAKRGAIYVATGDSYTDIREDASDAVVAIDIASGKIRWKRQMTENDSFLVGCGPQRRGVNCPTEVGPDHDFGASPILFTLPNGKDILLAGQKSSEVYGVDPDARGKVLWKVKLGAGGPLGGVEWGMASDGKRLYVANADTLGGGSPKAKPGLYALDPATGAQLWAAPAPKAPCGWPGGGGRCVNAQSAAPTSIPGAVLAATMDGHLRAYEAATGKIVWEVDTGAGRYQTVNGGKDQGGGAIDVGGPTVAGGMLYQVSGNNNGGGPHNVLLAFSVDGR